LIAFKQRRQTSFVEEELSPYPSLADAVQMAASKHYENLGSSWLGAIAKRLAAWSQ
jgi:hypothetical protein